MCVKRVKSKGHVNMKNKQSGLLVKSCVMLIRMEDKFAAFTAEILSTLASLPRVLCSSSL